jgi:hypothetical protein
MNSKLVKCGMVVLTEREKPDVTDADVVVGWMLWATGRALVVEREREKEKADMVWSRLRYNHSTTRTSLSS